MKFFTTAFLCAAIFFSAAEAFSADEKSVPVESETVADSEPSFEDQWPRIMENINHDLESATFEETVKNYAKGLFERSRGWSVPVEERARAIAMLSIAKTMQLRGDSGKSLDVYENVVYTFPATLFAAEALFQQSVVYTSRHQFDDAFSCVSSLIETYPGSDRVADAVAQGYLIAEAIRNGARPRRFGGLIPWLTDRHAALRFYDKLYSLVPNAEISPRLLFQKGSFASSISDEWFEGERKGDAIDAFERLISSHPESTLVPDAYLLLAGTYESLCIGAEWDQVSSRRALNYYTDFYSLYPEHPKAEFAYNKTETLRDLLAANRVKIGDFYYSRHNNLRAAIGFYREAITYAPDSPSGKNAREKIEKIRKGERAPRTIVDWLFGRYPSPVTTDFLDAPSQKSLDEMGFRAAGSLEDDRDLAKPAGTLEKQEYKDPKEQ